MRSLDTTSYKRRVDKWDVVVIGGGIAGLGIARECAAAGDTTLLLEAGRCGQATSNNSLRIIHGGFRYLQNFDMPRVLVSLADQSALLREVPNALRPLPCLMPLKRWGFKGRLPVSCAAFLYGALMRGMRSPLPPPRTVSSTWIRGNVPALREHAPDGALCWHDALMIDPDLITQYLKDSITTKGGQIHESTRVVSVDKLDQDFIVTTDTAVQYRARRVVNALGPWVDSIQLPAGFAGARPRWCRGFNLIIKKPLDPNYAFAIESKDGRLLFCVPRGSGTAIGTWYLEHPSTGDSHSSHHLALTEKEIAEFIEAFNSSLPQFAIDQSDIEAIDLGVLPRAPHHTSAPYPLAHLDIHHHRGYIEVVSTKYTTFRSVGRRVWGVG